MPRLSRLVRYASPHWRLLVLGILLSGGATLAQLASPLVLRFLIDEVLTRKQPELLGLAVSLMITAAAAIVILRGLEQYVFARLGGLVLIDVRRDMARHLTQLPLARLQSERTGQLMSLFSNDAPAMAKLYENMLGQTAVSAFRFILTVLMIFVIYRQLILVTLVAIPFYIAIPALLGKPTRQAGRALQEKAASVSADLQESISAARETKAFNRQRWLEERMRESFASLLQPQLKLTLLQSGSFATYIAFSTVAALIYWIGGTRVMAGSMTLGMLIASIAYFTQLDEPVSRFVNLNGQLQVVLAAGDRVLEFLDTRVEPADQPRAATIAGCEGRVEFERVSFAYQEGSPVLSNIVFTACPGQRTALVGPSGAGKTTLVSLIPRFFEPTRGRILIDGRDVRELTLESLRNSVGVVFQDSFLFAGSVRDNIRFGDVRSSEEEVVAAARAANAHEFIVRLPDGYETLVGERAVKLSGGQRQRLAIARALLRDPRILILDEATSALDSESELAVQEALDRVMAGRTTFVIAHRFSTIVNADAIIVLDKGRVAATGTHIELMSECELYYRLCSLQFSAEKRSGAESLPATKAMAR